MKACTIRTNHGKSLWIRKGLAALAVALIPLISMSIPLLASAGQQDVDLPDISEVDCASYIVFDRNTGATLISKEPDKRIYPASMTKIMTAILALEYLDPDQILTVSQSAINATTPNSTLMGLKVGEQMSVSELLYGLLLPSGNDAANVLAEAVVAVTGPVNTPTPTEETQPTNPDGTLAVETTAVPVEVSLLTQFADVMNRKASELGLVNTHFMNANGLHDENHYTTASELAKIFDCALGYEKFREVISSPTHVFKATNIHTFDAWSIARNTNLLLTDPWILGPETKVAQVVGGKTGTTIPAGTGMTLLSINKNGDELITIVCGIPYENASRLTSYMACVLNAGADACYANDPVVRVEGSVMDNKPANVSSGFEAAVIDGVTPLPTGTTSPTSLPTADANPTATIVPSHAPQKEADAGIIRLMLAHPLISAGISIFVILVLLLVITYFVANRKRKSSRNGIRRI